MDSVRTVVNTVVNWLSPPDKPAGEETPPGAANSTTPRLGTMRDHTAAPSALKRAAPVEDGTLPEQFYTLNPEFLDDPDKWSYKDLQRLAKQLGVPGGGKGSRKQLVERLCEFNRENEQALEEDPERWPERGSNFNLVPVNIEVKHAAATRGGAAASGGAAAGGAAAGGGAAAAAAGLSVEVPSSLRDNTTALISPLVPKGPGAASNKRKRDGAQPMRPASALRKKSKYSPSNKEYLERIETTASDSTALQNADTSPSAAAQRHRESPAINFSPFNRVNLIPAKEEYDEYRAEFADEPEVKTLFG